MAYYSAVYLSSTLCVAVLSCYCIQFVEAKSSKQLFLNTYSDEDSKEVESEEPLDREPIETSNLRYFGQSTVLDQVAKSMVQGLRQLLGTSICVQGLREDWEGEGYLTLNDGHLTGLDTLFNMSSNLLRNKGENIEFEMHFAFKNLPLSFKFDYLSTTFGISKLRHGEVDLVLEGRNVVTVQSLMISDLEHVPKDATRSKSCYLDVVSVETTAIGLVMSINRFQYESLTNNLLFGSVASNLKSTILSMKYKIQKLARDALQIAMRQAVRKLSILCNANELETSVTDCINPLYLGEIKN